MRIRGRLDKLARLAHEKGQAYDYAAVLARQQAREAWLRGEGPEPEPEPCPYWWDPEKWASRQRTSRAIGLCVRGEYEPGQPMEDLTDDEVKYVAQIIEVMLQVAGQARDGAPALDIPLPTTHDSLLP
jgi:hypothetical protein